MKSVKIFYFSGTGNTKRVGNMLKERFEDKGLSVKLLSIEKDVLNDLADLDDSSQLTGIAYPIYGFGTPANVERFVEKMPSSKGARIFLAKTGADFIAINHSASENIIGKLEEKGYKVFYDRIIAMPANWVVGYSDGLAQQLVKSAEEKAAHMCDELMRNVTRTYSPGPFIRSLSLAIARLEGTYGSSYFGMSLRADESCDLCGLCVKNCPAGNIEKEEVLSFGQNCLWCMRCIYNCPRNAIHSKGYQFCVLKKGYDLNRSLENVSDPGKIVTDRTKGYFKHFYKYLNDASL